jgi:hypothetical protein
VAGPVVAVRARWRPEQSLDLLGRGDREGTLGLAPEDDIRVVIALCDRLCAMLTRLAGIRGA